MSGTPTFLLLWGTHINQSRMDDDDSVFFKPKLTQEFVEK